MKELFSITLSCLNDSTTHNVAFIDKDFTGGRINWTLKLTPPIGYSRELSVDSFKFVRSDFQYIWQRFIVYGNLLKINLEVFKNGVSYGTYRINISDGTTFLKNKCICSLSASGVEADFAAKKESEILVPKNGTITNAGDFKEMNNIKKLDFQTYRPTISLPFYQFASDLITPLGTNELVTSDTELIKFKGYSGAASMVINFQIGLLAYSTEIADYENTWRASIILAKGTNVNSVGNIDLVTDLEFTTIMGTGGQEDKIVFNAQTFDVYVNVPTADATWNVYLKIYDTVNGNVFSVLKGNYLTMFFLSTVGYSLPEIDGYTIGNVFNHIFGAGNYSIQNSFALYFFTNYDAFSRTNDNAQLKIKVSEFLTDFCKAADSTMVLENGIYVFRNVGGWIETLNTLELDYVKDVEFSILNTIDIQELEVGQKMPTYKNIENSRETFNQKITWKVGDYGNKYDLSFTKMRADYTGIFDLVIEQSKGVDVQNPDYWIIEKNDFDATVKPNSVTGLFQQTGWFNFNFSPRDLLIKNRSTWRGLFSFFANDDTMNVSTAENLLTKVEYNGNGKQLDPLVFGADSTINFTNIGIKFTTLLTETNFLILKDKINKLEILFNGENLLVLPTSIEISPLNKQEAQITGVLINLPTK